MGLWTGRQASWGAGGKAPADSVFVLRTGARSREGSEEMGLCTSSGSHFFWSRALMGGRTTLRGAAGGRSLSSSPFVKGSSRPDEQTKGGGEKREQRGKGTWEGRARSEELGGDRGHGRPATGKHGYKYFLAALATSASTRSVSYSYCREGVAGILGGLPRRQARQSACLSPPTLPKGGALEIWVASSRVRHSEIPAPSNFTSDIALFTL